MLAHDFARLLLLSENLPIHDSLNRERLKYDSTSEPITPNETVDVNHPDYVSFYDTPEGIEFEIQPDFPTDDPAPSSLYYLAKREAFRDWEATQPKYRYFKV